MEGVQGRVRIETVNTVYTDSFAEKGSREKRRL